MPSSSSCYSQARRQWKFASNLHDYQGLESEHTTFATYGCVHCILGYVRLLLCQMDCFQPHIRWKHSIMQTKPRPIKERFLLLIIPPSPVNDIEEALKAWSPVWSPPPNIDPRHESTSVVLCWGRIQRSEHTLSKVQQIGLLTQCLHRYSVDCYDTPFIHTRHTRPLAYVRSKRIVGSGHNLSLFILFYIQFFFFFF